MSTKTKKPIAKKVVAAKAKPAAKKTPVKAKTAGKKQAVKAKPATKKPADKKQVAKKVVPVAKKPTAAKAKPESKAKKTATPKPVTAPSEAEAKDMSHKPITVIQKKPAKPPLKKPEEPTMFENQSQSFAFSFAEQMKRQQRDEDERKKASTLTIKLSRRPTTRAKGQNTQQFPAADLAEFRKRLIFLRQEALGQSATLRTIALEQTEDRIGEEEDGSDAFLRLQNLSQVDSQNKVIQKIDEALHRIAEGTYGICEVCGQLIRKPRLLNLPFVHTCMECQSEMEKSSGSR